MIKQSLRPTPLVFRYQASFIATFTLKCSLHIRIWNIFYLILQLAKQNLFTLQPLSFYADLQHYLASLDTNFETILLSSTYQRITMVSRELFMLERSIAIWEFSVDYSRTFYFSFTPTTHFLPRKTGISTFEKIAQFSLPKVQPATEQSIMMDVFRGVASIAFCL